MNASTMIAITNWTMQLQRGLKTRFAGGKCTFIISIRLCTTNIISGMYPVYKEVALTPLAVKKAITPTRKKATSPSFSHPGRRRQTTSQLILLLWVHRARPILLQLLPLLSRWLLAPHLKFPPLLWHQLIARRPSLKHPSLLLLSLLHLLLTRLRRPSLTRHQSLPLLQPAPPTSGQRNDARLMMGTRICHPYRRRLDRSAQRKRRWHQRLPRRN